ncbi:hypothetical protein CC1G_00969 [Coprinopsis cinerea okayama7|uniref:Ataxin-10 homolog n=1 Tax=Coprinopsis cinerea (strain Okayama-7 / 130 / ATCC MYA-4618 / FGSC 9003) TaxID=240176 RepID=A8N994_COPC7|nr:hypothetical protein CC1G_00969 [Coprinopsis cinerea okayama7\|eukprot:XP_001831422.2 hypothetical protein CC1G_00969 [Coprinopsis cinerea okayama7\
MDIIRQQASPDEVATAFHVPLSTFLAPSRLRSSLFRGERPYWVLDVTDIVSQHVDVEPPRPGRDGEDEVGAGVEGKIENLLFWMSDVECGTRRLGHTYSSFQPVLSAPHHAAKPAPKTLNSELTRAVIAFRSLALSYATSSGSFVGTYSPKLRSGDVVVPAKSETILRVLGPIDLERSRLIPSSERDHDEISRSRRCASASGNNVRTGFRTSTRCGSSDTLTSVLVAVMLDGGQEARSAAVGGRGQGPTVLTLFVDVVSDGQASKLGAVEQAQCPPPSTLFSFLMAESPATNRSIAGQVRRACLGFDVKDKARVRSLASALDSSAQELTQGESVRWGHFYAGPPTWIQEDQALWSDLRRVWRELAHSQLTFWDNDDSEAEEASSNTSGSNDNNHLRYLCASLAKFTRNVVVGVPENQSRAFENEPEIRRLLHYYTSWSAMEDPESTAVARFLTQTLSNIVTSNQTLVSSLWETYMNLPEDQVVLIRLLAAHDDRTLLTTLIFILNCIHGSRKRTKMLAKTAIGARVCVALLDGMLRLYEAEEESEGGKAFNVGYAIFTRLMEEGAVPELYKKFNMPDEIITPHQTTLLKLVDSYLQSIQLDISTSPAGEILQTHVALGPFLAKRFFTLSNYAQKAMQRSLESSKSKKPSAPSGKSHSKDDEAAGSSSSSATAEPLSELDVMLPKVCEALVLVTQCITTISLEAEEHKGRQFESGAVGNISNMKEFFIDVRFSGQGLIENLIGTVFISALFLRASEESLIVILNSLETLRLLDLFLPRIYFGKPVPSPNAPGGTINPAAQDSNGFSYVKRDLVRLLGVLAHESRAVQDRTRNANGLPVVMNLCVIDERNPCKWTPSGARVRN